MKSNNVLVTGSRGFIGRHLCKRLQNSGASLVDYDRLGQTVPDITDKRQLDCIEDVETIVHLAAKSSVTDSFNKPYETYSTNILGTLNLLDFARLKKIRRFIFISTYVYGQPEYLPIDEEHPVNPNSPYHKSKLIAERLCENYADDFGIDIVTLRPFYVYGPDTRPYPFISSAIRQIRDNGRVLLSGKNTKRDFLFIDDFIDLIESILNEFPVGYGLYNVGYGKSYKLAEVTNLLAKLMHRDIAIEYDTKMRPNDVQDMIAEISKVSGKFNWKPSVNLHKGLALTLKNSMVQ